MIPHYGDGHDRNAGTARRKAQQKGEGQPTPKLCIVRDSVIYALTFDTGFGPGLATGCDDQAKPQEPSFVRYEMLWLPSTGAMCMSGGCCGAISLGLWNGKARGSHHSRCYSLAGLTEGGSGAPSASA